MSGQSAFLHCLVTIEDNEISRDFFGFRFQTAKIQAAVNDGRRFKSYLRNQ